MKALTKATYVNTAIQVIQHMNGVTIMVMLTNRRDYLVILYSNSDSPSGQGSQPHLLAACSGAIQVTLHGKYGYVG